MTLPLGLETKAAVDLVNKCERVEVVVQTSADWVGVVFFESEQPMAKREMMAKIFFITINWGSKVRNLVYFKRMNYPARDRSGKPEVR